jgi:putative Holliday junction resolvase
MNTSKRLMGIDHGEVRIGIALTDPFCLFTSPHSILKRQADAEDFAAIQAIVEEKEVCWIVVGLPTATDGGIGMQAEIVIRWARKLAEAVSVPIVFWDESYTSVDAAAISQRKKKGIQHVDDIAAAAILQDYLDSGGADYGTGQTLEDFAHIP